MRQKGTFGVSAALKQYWIYGVYVLAAVVMFRLSRRPLRKLQKLMFAFVMNRVAIGYNRKFDKRKEKLFSEMQNMVLELRRPLEVLEIGAGSGANFKYFPKGTNVTCLDPNPQFESYLRKNSADFPHVNLREFLISPAEDMSQLLNSCVDAVVCTLVLCSVRDVDQCLREVKRVLRPGGKFFFLEHVAAERPTLLRRVQNLLTPVWRVCGDGCSLNRELWKNLADADFAHLDLQRFTVQFSSVFKGLVFPPVIRPHCSGHATK